MCYLTDPLIRRILGGPPAVPIHDPRLGTALQGWRVQQTWRLEAVGTRGMGRVRNWEPMGRMSERRGSITHKSGGFGWERGSFHTSWHERWLSLLGGCHVESTAHHGRRLLLHTNMVARNVRLGFLITEANKLSLSAGWKTDSFPRPFRTAFSLCSFVLRFSLLYFLDDKHWTTKRKLERIECFRNHYFFHTELYDGLHCAIVNKLNIWTSHNVFCVY